MKAFFYLIPVFILSFVSLAQPYYSIVSSDGTTKIAPDIYSALSVAKDGDIIYAPPGLFYVDTLVINKSVHIIGAGYNYLAAGTDMVTYWNGSISIENGADRGSLQGIFLNGNVHFGKKQPSPVNDYTIFRCFINGHILPGPDWFQRNNFSNLTIKESYIMRLSLGYATNTLISNCVLNHDLDYWLTYGNNTKIKNSIFIIKGSGFLTWSHYVIIENCIFTQKFSNNNRECSGIQFINNIFCFPLSDVPADGVIKNEGNITMPLSDVFVNFDGTNIDFSKTDFHLKPEAKNKIKGTDGTEVGIYGSNEPFKDYGIPINPFIKKSNVKSISRPDGKLKIEFEVEAQER